MFWCTEAVLLDVGDEVVELVDEEGDDADEACDADCQEAETDFADVEAVDWGVD